MTWSAPVFGEWRSFVVVPGLCTFSAGAGLVMPGGMSWPTAYPCSVVAGLIAASPHPRRPIAEAARGRVVMTTAELIKAAASLRGLLAAVERGELVATAGMVTFLAGVLASLDALMDGKSRVVSSP